MPPKIKTDQQAIIAAAFVVAKSQGVTAITAKRVALSKPQMWLLNAVKPIGNRLGWHKIMKENNTFANRLDTPYLD